PMRIPTPTSITRATDGPGSRLRGCGDGAGIRILAGTARSGSVGIAASTMPATAGAVIAAGASDTAGAATAVARDMRGAEVRVSAAATTLALAVDSAEVRVSAAVVAALPDTRAHRESTRLHSRH